MYKILIMHSKGGTGKTSISAALSDVLSNSQLVDLDPQKSLYLGMRHTKRKEVVLSLKEVNKKIDYLIIDSPPYRINLVEDLIQQVDKIIIPCCIGITDLITAAKTINSLEKLNLVEKAILVFNRVRLPINNTTKEIVQAFESNFKKIHISKTFLAERNAFKQVLQKEISGKARTEIESLVNELENNNNK